MNDGTGRSTRTNTMPSFPVYRPPAPTYAAYLGGGVAIQMVYVVVAVVIASPPGGESRTARVPISVLVSPRSSSSFRDVHAKARALSHFVPAQFVPPLRFSNADEPASAAWSAVFWRCRSVSSQPA
jgi:hypothetical protein